MKYFIGFSKYFIGLISSLPVNGAITESEKLRRFIYP